MISGSRSTLNTSVSGMFRAGISELFAERVSATVSLSLFILALFALPALPVQAQSDERPENWEDNRWRWFEVEVLVVRYTDRDDEDNEVFPLRLNPIPVEGSRELITPALRANIKPLLYALPKCTMSLGGEPLHNLPILDFIQVEHQQVPGTSINFEFEPIASGLTDLAESSLDAPPAADIAEHESGAYTDPVFCIPHKELVIVDAWYNDWQPYLDIELQRTPVQVTGGGGNIYTADIPFLVSEENLDLQGVRDRLARRPGVEPLLHTAWRQPVFGRTSGRKTRLFAGDNFTNRFRYDGSAIPSSEMDSDTEHSVRQERADLGSEASEIDSIERTLQAIERGDFTFQTGSSSEPGYPELQPMPSGVPDDVWEFDGLMHIYLVGNYLHIDGEFNLREPVTLPLKYGNPEQQLRHWALNEADEAEYLRGYYFKQLRRVISHQLHYFDHPKFGVLVEIRRTDLSRRR